MNHILLAIFEAVIFITALSTDAFIASLAYGSNKIKIPFPSLQVIAAICTGVLTVSLLLGTCLSTYLSEGVLKVISFTILLLMGIMKLMDNIIKSIIDKHTINKEIKFSLFNLNFILNVYANPKEADSDQSKTLSPKEAVSLALALSIDSLIAGVGAALGDVNIVIMIVSSFLLSMASVKAGEFIGYRISEKSPFQLSWLSGILLIFLAIFKFLH